MGERLTSRGRPLQGPPPPPNELNTFPKRPIPSGSRLWRASRRTEPWWFCSGGDCRFDLPRPFGTCYLGTDRIVGLVELLGPEMAGRPVTSSFVGSIFLYGLDLPAVAVVANLSDRKAIGYRASNELSGGGDYQVTQQWAVAFHEVGFDGIRYRTRFDTGTSPRGIALFGSAGRAPWPISAKQAVDAELRQALRRTCSISVVSPPGIGALDIVDLPVTARGE